MVVSRCHLSKCVNIVLEFKIIDWRNEKKVFKKLKLTTIHHSYQQQHEASGMHTIDQ